MNSYVKRLIKCGYSINEAYFVYRDFMRNYTTEDLEEFLESMENDLYVGRVQQ